MRKTFNYIGRFSPACWAGAVFLSALAVLVCYTIPTIKRVDGASAALLVCKYQDAAGKWHGNPACLQSSVLEITGEVKHTGSAITKAAPQIAAAAVKAADNSALASRASVEFVQAGTEVAKKLGDTVDVATQTVKDLDYTVDALRNAVLDVDTSIKPLLASSNETVQAAGRTLNELTALEKQLGEVLGTDNAKALQIAERMLQILDDPNIQIVLGNVNAAAGSFAEIAKTIDIATRGLRQKAALVKTILLKIVGMITVPLR